MQEVPVTVSPASCLGEDASMKVGKETWSHLQPEFILFLSNYRILIVQVSFRDW